MPCSTEIEERLRRFHDKAEAKNFAQTAAKARTKDSLKAFSRLTEEIEGEPPRIVSDPPLIVPIRELYENMEDAAIASAEELEHGIHVLFRIYRRSLQRDRQHLLEGFQYRDLARKVVGVDSVGTRTWMMLLLGRDSGDPLFLQFKEANESVLEPLLSPAAGGWHAPTPARATGSRSPRTSARATRSTWRSRTSPRRTPI
jgi:hypothetical protein